MGSIKNIPTCKKKIPMGGIVYPCRVCGEYPIWGAGFLLCPKGCFESDMNYFRGVAVRSWNKENQPKDKKNEEAS